MAQPSPDTLDLVARLEASDPEGRYAVRVGRRFDAVLRDRARQLLVDRADGRLYRDVGRRGACMGPASGPWVFCLALARVVVDTPAVREMNDRDRARGSGRKSS